MSDSSDLAQRVLAIVAVIPPGNVSSYGEVAKLAGCGARNVGTVMNRYGGNAAWWRVVRANGACHDPVRAEEYWDREGIEHSNGRVAMHKHGMDARDLNELLGDDAMRDE